MPDRKLFYDDAALTSVDTVVVDSGESDGRAWLRLEETVFYPEGGGQPADRGTIDGIPVVAVRSRGSQVLHFVVRLPEGRAVTARIDGGWRFDLRQQHTAQHLLSALLDDRHGRPTTSFHLGEQYTAIEVSGAVLTEAALRGLEAEANACLRENRVVTTSWVEPEALATLDVRTRGLPEGHAGPVRLVEIEGIDRNTCGGTHVGRLGEIQAIQLLDAEAARGGTRIRFLAGDRLLRETARLQAQESLLKKHLGTGPDEFTAALEAKEARQRALERRLREMAESLAILVAAEIAREPGPRRVRHLRGWDPEMLRALAARLAKEGGAATVVLVGTFGNPEEACFVVQAGPEGPADVSDEAALVAALLNARGGGRDRFRQGRGGRWPGDEAFERFARNPLDRSSR